ncbi:MAG: hybrid sensor histidine kinase/response regulator [Planctomycetes bacterium]|nr:hybrid sensor histidine kinase/response regulator [Planctomycetota bacterium]
MTAGNAPRVPNILIVDDTPANLLLMERMLAERGYRPRPVPSGRLALEAAHAEPPDLILLDISMPEMNGYEVCARLKADTALKEIPVIFVSAMNETIDKLKAFRAGAVDYVTKPFQFEEVYARIQTHLQLRRLESFRDDLIHLIVHDLRNPLAVICNFLEILELREIRNLSTSSQELVPVARRNARDLLEMIGSLLDVSKMRAGELKLQREPNDLCTLIRAVLDITKPLPGGRTVTLEVPEAPVTIIADVGLVRRVFRNLLSNALKFTPDGGDIRVVVALSASEVRVSVTDKGPGISPEHHQRIFEKFGQVEDGTSRPGTGLGLTFCKLAVEAHGGRIGVESEVGKGSTFWLELPRLSQAPSPVGTA